MARVLQEHVKRPLAEPLLFGKLAGGGTSSVKFGPGGDSLVLDIRPVKLPRAARTGMTSSPRAVDDAALGEVVGRQFDRHGVARQVRM